MKIFHICYVKTASRRTHAHTVGNLFCICAQDSLSNNNNCSWVIFSIKARSVGRVVRLGPELSLGLKAKIRMWSHRSRNMVDDEMLNPQACQNILTTDHFKRVRHRVRSHHGNNEVRLYKPCVPKQFSWLYFLGYSYYQPFDY